MEQLDERIIQLQALKEAIEHYSEMERIAAEHNYEPSRTQYHYIFTLLCEIADELTR